MRADIVVYNLLNDLSLRAYPMIVPQTAAVSGAVTYTTVDTEPVQSQNMLIDSEFVKVQISIFHTIYNTCQTNAQSIIDDFEGKKGTVTVDATDYKYQNIRLENKEDLGFVEKDNVFMVALDFSIMMYI